MTRQHGKINLDAAIPRMRFAAEPGEGTAAYMARVAAATAFAYAMPAEFETQPGFSYEVDSLVLPTGSIARGRVKGRVRLVRNAALVAATGIDALFVYLLLSGSATVLQGRRRRAIHCGDIFVHDLAEPAEIVLDGYDLLLLVVGRGALPEAVRERSLDGAVVAHDHPLTAVVTGLIASIHDGAPRLRPAHASTAFDAAMTLLGTALADVTAAGRVPLSVKASAETLIDSCLSDPDLSPEQVAGRLDVSRATLYRAFQPYGGVRLAIADRRLHHAWTLCSAHPPPSTAEVAARCGYRSASKLDRAMKAAFGMKARDLGSAPAGLAAAGMVDVMSNNWRRVTGGA